jgi:cytochrome d ubiquinol oxidase subunit II
MLVIIFGAALGNIIRGVPLDSKGEFFEPLWTTFTVVPQSGILDWFTILMAIVAVITLSSHGANYIALKTEGGLQNRARMTSRKMNIIIILVSIIMFISTSIIRPQMWDNYLLHNWGFIFPLAGIAGAGGMIYFRAKSNDLITFISSSMFIFGMLSGTAFGLYPSLLPSSVNSLNSLTIHNSKAGEYGLGAGIYWWIAGIILAIIYFTCLFYIFKGKIKITGESEEY